MEAVVNVVLPVFGLILVGYLAGRFAVLGEASSEALNRFVYYFALPALLFLGMARVPIGQVFNGRFIAAYMGGVLVVLAFAVLVARFAFPGRLALTGMHGLCAVFSNTGYMGIPLFLTAFGAEGTLPAVIATVINAAVVIGGGVVMIEFDISKRGGWLGPLLDVTAALAVNPLVVAPLAGIAYAALGLPLPKAIITFGELLGGAAGPCALFAMGLFLATRPVQVLLGGGRAVEVAWLIVLKLLAQPLLTWALAVAFGLDAFWVASAVILSALPTGALAFVLAQRYGLYVERSSAAILGSTVLSALTLSLGFVLLKPALP